MAEVGQGAGWHQWDMMETDMDHHSTQTPKRGHHPVPATPQLSHRGPAGGTHSSVGSQSRGTSNTPFLQGAGLGLSHAGSPWL